MDRSPPADTSSPTGDYTPAPDHGIAGQTPVTRGFTPHPIRPPSTAPSAHETEPPDEPPVTRRGRAIRPPIKYADYDMGTCRARLKGTMSSKLQVRFSF